MGGVKWSFHPSTPSVAETNEKGQDRNKRLHSFQIGKLKKIRVKKGSGDFF